MSEASQAPSGRASLPALPDLRQEQFFLSTVRQYIDVEDAEEEGELVPITERTTPWHHTKNIRCLFMEQFVSPLWQGMLWGLGGVALAHARQAMAIARAHRMRSPTAQAKTLAKEAEKTAPTRQLFSSWIARLGLSRLFL